MITGTVTPEREAVISLVVRGPAGQEEAIQVIIDTGFTGSLTLPLTLVVSLGLSWLTRGRVELGNGSVEVFDIYTGFVLWDGQPLRIMVDAAETTPLVGMSLMYGYELNMPILDGAVFTLQRI